MSRRTGVGLLAFAMMIVLWAVAGFASLPYVTYTPGPTVDVLASSGGEEIVQVKGHEAYHDDGELRLTTIFASEPEQRVTLPELLRAYFDDDAAVYPRSAVYAPDETDENSDRMAEVQMVSSQDNAIAVALQQLGHEVPTTVRVLDVSQGMPAEGRLRIDDEVLRVGFIDINQPQDVVEAVGMAKAGEPLQFAIRRNGAERTVTVTPTDLDGRPFVGITPGTVHEFPFDVKVDIGDNIGGPSAGLMLALAVYDTLTPGSLTDGGIVAGTGAISPEGAVGSIGGVQQKIAGARDTGAELFLVPADNCDSVGGVDPGDMRLARVASMDEALDVIEKWADDPDTDLPTCEDNG